MNLKTPTPDELGLSAGLEIHRSRAPSRWPDALEALEPVHRPAAETYLRGIAERMRFVRDNRAQLAAASAAAKAKEQADKGRAAAFAAGALLLVLVPAVIAAPGIRATVTVANPDGTVTTIGPCVAQPGPLVDYAGTRPEIVLGLDCAPIFQDGFE